MRYSVRSLARPLLENADKKLIKSKGEVNRLKILVCVKQVPDTTEIKIDPVTNTLIRNGVPSIVNPFDKNALEAALQLKDKYGAEVTVLSMGPGQAAEQDRGEKTPAGAGLPGGIVQADHFSRRRHEYPHSLG